MTTIAVLDPLDVARRPDAVSLDALQAAIATLKAEGEAGDRKRLADSEQLEDCRRLGRASTDELNRLEAQLLEVNRANSARRDVITRLELAWSRRTSPLEHPERGRPHELEDQLELARPKLAAAERALAAHDAARARLLSSTAPDSALERHDAARPALAREVERCAAGVERLEKALAAVRERWPVLTASFEADLAAAKKSHAEGLRLLREYLEKAAPYIADLLERLEAIDQGLASLRERSRYLEREAECPASPNHAVRPGQVALYHVGGPSPEVRLPGADRRAIWPRPRGTTSTNAERSR